MLTLVAPVCLVSRAIRDSSGLLFKNKKSYHQGTVGYLIVIVLTMFYKFYNYEIHVNMDHLLKTNKMYDVAR